MPLFLPQSLHPKPIIRVKQSHIILAKLSHRSGVRERALDLLATLEDIPRIKHIDHLLVEESILLWPILLVVLASLRYGVLDLLGQ